MSSYLKCNFAVGDKIAPIEEEFHKIFRHGNTAEKLMEEVESGGSEVLEVKQYDCTCPESNGGQHCCILNTLGCDQVIYLMVNGKKKPFAGIFFRHLTA